MKARSRTTFGLGDSPELGRSCPNNRHAATVSACLFSANRRHSISDASPNSAAGLIFCNLSLAAFRRQD
jgi:hypothetical protein